VLLRAIVAPTGDEGEPGAELGGDVDGGKGANDCDYWHRYSFSGLRRLATLS
jgi:hypothetical protein